MRVLIEEYRGFEILFETEDESFYCSSLDHKIEKKRSFSSAKSNIDDYVKANQTFKSIVVFEKPDDCNLADNNHINIVGMRKDNRFVILEKNGSNSQLSEYKEKSLIFVEGENVPIYEMIIHVQDEERDFRDMMRKKRDNLILQLKCKTLAEYKKELCK